MPNKRGRDAEDKEMKDPKPSDTIIPVIGMTGAGKSQFINKAAKKNATAVGSGLESCTKVVKAVTVRRSDGRRIVLIDTPGFNDTSREDSKIAKRIIDWLTKSYQPGKKFAGIIYMHEIDQCRMVASSSSLEMLKRFYGEGAAKNVVLVTTKWRNVVGSRGDEREQELREGCWRPLLDRGATIGQFEDTYDSAWRIIDSIVDNELEPIAIPLPSPADPDPDPIPRPRVRPGIWKRLFGWGG